MSAITKEQYFAPNKLQSAEATQAVLDAAEYLLIKVNAFLAHCAEQGKYEYPVDPDTGSCISGSPPRATMSGDGGFRLPTTKTNPTVASKHKIAHAVDVFDPHDDLDRYINQFEEDAGRNSLLQEFGLFREAPHATPGWCHLQDIPPGSGRRTFNP